MQEFNSLFDMMEAFPTEQHAIDHLREIRWGKDDVNAHCPHCGSTKVYHFSDNKNHKCGDCRKRFSIKVGTIFEDSKIQLRKWFMAIWLITSHKKGIASTTLAKDIKVTQKTAWFMLHRLRHASQTKSFNAPFDGDVEVDEAYIGGKAINMHKHQIKARKQYEKAAVVGVIKRNGELRAKHIPITNKINLHGMVHEHVSTDARLITDSSHMYKGLNGEYNHEVINHHKGEYVRDDIHTNSIESVWALLKRQISGTHHWVSKKHLQAYVNEMTWRFNRRDHEEGQRVNSLLGNVQGRLTYMELTA
ncbi:MAG: DDE transposase [Robiginitomaculum sp.]|nr:MAG: DDE transposase [Robiginitomaculum sp.]